jgi:hypothetical protein
MIFFLGLAGLARTLLSKYNADGVISGVTFASCVLAALTVAHLIEARSPLTARVCSSCLGMIGFGLAVASGDVMLIAPIVAAVAMFILTVGGEACFRLFHTPADQQSRSADPADPANDAANQAAPSRGTRHRSS